MADLVIHIPNQVPRKYPVPESFTYRELQTIKTVTGLRPAELEDALSSGDPDIVIALGIICAKRAGHTITEDDLLDLEVGGITIEGDEDESDPTSGVVDDEATPAETILADGGTQD
jgi:hypothetical protein